MENADVVSDEEFVVERRGSLLDRLRGSNY